MHNLDLFRTSSCQNYIHIENLLEQKSKAKIGIMSVERNLLDGANAAKLSSKYIQDYNS